MRIETTRFQFNSMKNEKKIEIWVRNFVGFGETDILPKRSFLQQEGTIVCCSIAWNICELDPTILLTPFVFRKEYKAF